MNKFIELETNEKNWEDNAIYSIGVYSIKADFNFSFYVGEAEVYSNRGWNYDEDVIDEYGKHQYSSRVIQIKFKEDNVKKKLEYLSSIDCNPFDTVDLKKFRRIIEKSLIDTFRIPSKFNKRRDYFKQEELSAGFILYVLSRKYKVVSECLDIMSKLNIADFDYKNSKFIIFDEDLKETIELKSKINSLASEVLDFIQRGKFLEQGGYQCMESNIIYEDSRISVILGGSGSGMSLCDRLWNTEIGGECLLLYKTSEGTYNLIVNPSDKGLGVDIIPWISKWNHEFKLDLEIIEKIKKCLLTPSLM